MRQRFDGVVGSRIGALNQNLPYARRISNRQDRIPQLLLFLKSLLRVFGRELRDSPTVF